MQELKPKIQEKALEFNDLDKKRLYSLFVRPLLGTLLSTLKIDKHYTDGDGNWLFYEGKKIFDAAGGYGANLLGHKNQILLQEMNLALFHGAPMHTQGSIRYWAGQLAKKLSELLEAETKQGPWISHFTNSGAEAVEAALKHALIYHFEKKQKINISLNESYHLLLKQTDFKKVIIQIQNKLPSLKIDFTKCQSIQNLVSMIKAYNEEILGQKVQYVAVENAFHGKTLGALKVTYNPKYRVPFQIENETIFLSKTNIEENVQKLQSTRSPLIYYIDHECHLEFYTPIVCAIAEPIQGEGGVNLIEKQLLDQLKADSKTNDYLLILDEVQAGMYRTGTLCASKHQEIVADIYCFSKALGGGITKIAATSILKSKYVDDFGLLHTSTFSEDEISSRIAYKVLEILNQDTNIIQGMQVAKFLKIRLKKLKDEFPDLILEVKGEGLMLALSLNPEIGKACYEFKMFHDASMLGYLFSSALLENEHIRILPTMSNGLVLRIQPSIFTTIEECYFLSEGLKNFLDSIHHLNMPYFLNEIFTPFKISATRPIQENIEINKLERPLAVFLCHLIDGEHAKKFTPSLEHIPGSILETTLANLKTIIPFEVYYSNTILNQNGQAIDIALMAVPITSEELKKSFIKTSTRHKVTGLIQDAIDYAKSLGATTVGLGQFTSIVSKNGLFLNLDNDLNLTTGNAYTAALSLEAAFFKAKEKNLDLFKSNAICIGAAGNIISTLSSIVADHVGSLTLFYHTEINKSAKLANSVRKIILDIISSDADSPCVKEIKKAVPAIPESDEDFFRLLEKEDVQKYFKISTKEEEIQNADLIITGTNSSKPFLKSELFKTHAIIVDLGVPANVEETIKQRKDISYILGGIAHLPPLDGLIQNIKTPIFPLDEGECFACMAETFTLGFSNLKGIHNLGDLNKQQVLQIKSLADKVGFGLAGIKIKNSL